jgi:serine/threonine protein kinase
VFAVDAKLRRPPESLNVTMREKNEVMVEKTATTRTLGSEAHARMRMPAAAAASLSLNRAHIGTEPHGERNGRGAILMRALQGHALAPAQRYRRVKKLGEGGFGKVYLVEDLHAQRHLRVLKEVNVGGVAGAGGGGGGSEEAAQQALAEVQVLRQLRHPNIIEYHDCFCPSPTQLCIVMGYADGGDLEQRLAQRRGQPLPEAQVVEWLLQLLLALKHMHDRKILHRDIKCQNIFLMRNNTLKLGDFGISRTLDHTLQKACTQIGTPFYISPEMCQERPYDHKSDMWAVGVVLYQLMALRQPFQASSMPELVRKIVSQRPPPIGGLWSADLRNLLSALLQKDPGLRPSANEALRLPFVRKHIGRFLSAHQLEEEFSHTVLHGHVEAPRHESPQKQEKDSQPVAQRAPDAAPEERRLKRAECELRLLRARRAAMEGKAHEAARDLPQAVPERKMAQVNHPEGFVRPSLEERRRRFQELRAEAAKRASEQRKRELEASHEKETRHILCFEQRVADPLPAEGRVQVALEEYRKNREAAERNRARAEADIKGVDSRQEDSHAEGSQKTPPSNARQSHQAKAAVHDAELARIRAEYFEERQRMAARWRACVAQSGDCGTGNVQPGVSAAPKSCPHDEQPDAPSQTIEPHAPTVAEAAQFLSLMQSLRDELQPGAQASDGAEGDCESGAGFDSDQEPFEVQFPRGQRGVEQDGEEWRSVAGQAEALRARLGGECGDVWLISVLRDARAAYEREHPGDAAAAAELAARRLAPDKRHLRDPLSELVQLELAL